RRPVDRCGSGACGRTFDRFYRTAAAVWPPVSGRQGDLAQPGLVGGDGLRGDDFLVGALAATIVVCRPCRFGFWSIDRSVSGRHTTEWCRHIALLPQGGCRQVCRFPRRLAARYPDMV